MKGRAREDAGASEESHGGKTGGSVTARDSLSRALAVSPETKRDETPCATKKETV